MPTVYDIVKAWLEEHGYEGLCTEECGCPLDDLMCCDGCDSFYVSRCEPGFKQPHPTGEFEFIIAPLSNKQEAIKRRLANIAKLKAKPVVPAPRYDDIYAEGVAQLDRIGEGEPE